MCARTGSHLTKTEVVAIHPIVTLNAALGEALHESLRAGESLHLRVEGTSMLPLLRPGDYVLAISTPLHTLSFGDLAVFRRDGVLITHRVISREGEGIRTCGDNASSADNFILKGDVLGRVASMRRGTLRIDFSTRRWAIAGVWLARLTHLQVDTCAMAQRMGLPSRVVRLVGFSTRLVRWGLIACLLSFSRPLDLLPSRDCKENDF